MGLPLPRGAVCSNFADSERVEDVSGSEPQGSARELRVECLRCGQPRDLVPHEHRGGREHRGDECPRCGYVGWAGSSELTELERRRLRERPLEERRPYAA